jgi:ADP-ribose pyrophosphatase YjhB (NUDIX family)
VPGGRVRPGETLAEAVVRELMEETGIEGVCGRLIGLVELLPDDDRTEHLVILDYEVSILEATEPEAADDAAEARWVDLGDVAEHQLAPGLAEFLHDHGIIATIT